MAAPADTSWDSEIISLYVDDQLSIRAISERLPGTYTWVRNRLVANKVKLRKQGGTHTTRLSHQDMYLTIYLYRDCELSITRVARKLQLAHSTVRERLVNAGVPLRSKSESYRAYQRQCARRLRADPEGLKQAA